MSRRFGRARALGRILQKECNKSRSGDVQSGHSSPPPRRATTSRTPEQGIRHANHCPKCQDRPAVDVAENWKVRLEPMPIRRREVPDVECQSDQAGARRLDLRQNPIERRQGILAKRTPGRWVCSSALPRNVWVASSSIARRAGGRAPT
jgi:hypothetical protein